MKNKQLLLVGFALPLLLILAGCSDDGQDRGQQSGEAPEAVVFQEFLENCSELDLSTLPQDPTTELPPEAEQNFIAEYNRVRGLAVDRYQLPRGADLPRSLVEICPNIFLVVNNLGRSYIFDASDSKTYAFGEMLVPRAIVDPSDPIAEFFNTPARIDDLGLRDLLVHDSKLFFSSVEYKKKANCIASTIYRVNIDLKSNEFEKPELVFEIEPCLSQLEGATQEGLLNPSESGGRLQNYKDGKVLLTTGPFAFGYSLANPSFIESITPYFEEYINKDNSQYGAILQLSDLNDELSVDIFARGFRNPQGLAVTPSGDIWLSDHGPAGGDELNFVEEGGHYGWPFQTYGLPYDNGTVGKPWDVNEFWSERYELNSDDFADPIFSWKPSVAPSEVVFYTQQEGEFADFYGKLLVSTLRDNSIRVLTIKDQRVVIDSPIYVNERIRDLAISSVDGKIYALTDSFRLLKISQTDITPGS